MYWFYSCEKKPIEETPIVGEADTIYEQQKIECGTPVLFQNEEYLQKLEAAELIVQQLKAEGRILLETKITIPIAFHIMYTNSKNNISDAQLESAVADMNKAFAGEGRYDTEPTNISFVIDQINRVDLSGDAEYRTKGITYSDEARIKNKSKADPKKYMNVWVVAGINGNMGGYGVQGYAYLPANNNPLDGIVNLYNAIGTVGELKLGTDLNNTFVHEAGHSLGLYHTFEGDDGNRDGVVDRCPSENGCGAYNGDCVDDTPAHRRTLFNCPTGNINVCDPIGQTPGPAALYVHNIMNYSSDQCADEFTAGQIQRAKYFLNSIRSGWRTEEEPADPIDPPGTFPEPDNPCASKSKYTNKPYKIGITRVQIEGTAYVSGDTKEDNGYVNRWQDVFTIEPGCDIDLLVETGPWNRENVKVYISEEEVFSSEKQKKTHKGKIDLCGVPEGIYRMRVISDFSFYQISGPCYKPVFGQAEDYTLIIDDDD